MALMIFAAIWENRIGSGYIIWIPAVVLHFAALAFFCSYLVHLDLKAVKPSWIIVTIGGVTVASGTGRGIIGESSSYFFWAGLVAACFILPLTLYCAHTVDAPEVQAPLYAIFAAPIALLLVNWITIGGTADDPLTHALAVTEAFLFVLVCTRLPLFLSLPFNPSMAAFTFPAGIAARAFLLYAAAFAADGGPVGSAPLPLPIALLAAAFAAAAAFVVLATLARSAAWVWGRVELATLHTDDSV